MCYIVNRTIVRHITMRLNRKSFYTRIKISKLNTFIMKCSQNKNVDNEKISAKMNYLNQ